jgi:hypothetical protein
MEEVGRGMKEEVRVSIGPIPSTGLAEGGGSINV